MPLFSIITPVYNSGQFLAKAVQSVIEQDFKDLEMILVDDGSTDTSGALCDAFCKQHDCIKVIHHEKNLGISTSRNAAIKAARGEYILFLDSDDCLFNGCLAGLARLIAAKPGRDLIIGKYTSERYSLRNGNAVSHDFTFDNAGTDTNNPDGAIAHLKNFSRLAGVCWRFAINRNFLVKNNLYFIQARIYEDQEYVARLLCLANTFAFYDQCLYWYRARPGSITASITHSMHYDNSAACLNVVAALCKLLHNQNLSNLKREFLYTRIKISLVTFFAHLPMHSREEIRRFSKIIDSNIGDFAMLEAMPDRMDVSRFIHVHGAYYGLLLLKAYVTEKTMTLIEGAEHKTLYIFCADLFGKATAQILKNEGHAVQCFLDNNRGLEGSTVLDLAVNTPSILLGKSREALADAVVIVCHQRKEVFESMVGQLESMGLKREQIVHQVFG